jgi:CheY-like chemotaxis protein
MAGDQLAAECLKLRPDIPVIACTGYSSRLDQQSDDQTGIRAVLMKPINLSDLALCVRRVLDQPVSGDRAL